MNLAAFTVIIINVFCHSRLAAPLRVLEDAVCPHITWMEVPVKRELVSENEEGLVWPESKTQAVLSNLHPQGWTGSSRTGRRSTEKGKFLKTQT